MKKIPRPNCLICNKETKRHTTKTCSLECRNILQIKNFKKECLICKIIFKPSNKDSKFCSLDCMHKNMIGRSFSDEHKKKISNYAKTRIGKLNPMYGKKAAHGKGYWHETWNNQKVFLRSSWELGFAKYLDSKQILYEVESKRFPIIYSYKGEQKSGTYCPDFYLPDRNKYYEVKGWWRDDAKIKFDAFNDQYPEVINILVTSVFLKKLKIQNIRLK